MSRLMRGAAVVAALMGLGVVSAYGQAPDLSRMDIVMRAVPDGPVARVGTETIDPDEFRDLYAAELARYSQMSGRKDYSDLDRIEMAMRCLRILVERSILYQEGLNRGVSVSDAELQAEWTEEVQRLARALSRDRDNPLSEEQVLEIAQTTKEEALAELRRTLVIEKMRARIMEERNVTVSDAEVEAFFEENKTDTASPDRVHMLQMFFRKPAPNSNDTPEKARERAVTALQRVRSGESFAAVARTASDPPFSEASGDVGPVPVRGLPQALQATAMRLKPGEMSDVVETEVGFHIVQMQEIMPGEAPTLENSGPQIRQLLMARKGNQAVREFCADVTEGKDYIEIFLDFDKQIRTRPDLQRLFEGALSEESDPTAGSS